MTNSIECFSKAEVILVTGSNTTENHPVIANRIRLAVGRGAKLLLFEPRDIPLVHQATLWCRQKPGTDVAWINGLMHAIIKEGLADMDFVETRTEGYEELRSAIAKYTPQMVSGITGIPACRMKGTFMPSLQIAVTSKPRC